MGILDYFGLYRAKRSKNDIEEPLETRTEFGDPQREELVTFVEAEAEAEELPYLPAERDLSIPERFEAPTEGELARLPPFAEAMLTGTPERPGQITGKYKPPSRWERVRSRVAAPIVLAAVIVGTAAVAAALIRSL